MLHDRDERFGFVFEELISIGEQNMKQSVLRSDEKRLHTEPPLGIVKSVVSNNFEGTQRGWFPLLCRKRRRK